MNSLLFAVALLILPQQFSPGCTLPFAAIAEDHPIDNSCSDREGNATSMTSRLQNRVKNNFCAGGQVVSLTKANFISLQKKADQMKAASQLKFGSNNSLPEDRSVVQGQFLKVGDRFVGEGSLVRYVAFIIEARHSNVSNGEGVNCSKGGKESNDIHIEMSNKADDDLCNTVSVEISPHFRPSVWGDLPENPIHHRPLRIRGQLFFDASHGPCTPGKMTSPPRASIWEIHPVYAIDVCEKTTLAACKVNDESVWLPLDEWLNENEEDDQ
jgi:hypothetical protein